MTEAEEQRLRGVETDIVRHTAHWEEQARLNDTIDLKHKSHFSHIKDIRAHQGFCLTEQDMTEIENKVDTLQTMAAEQRGADKAWRLIAGAAGFILVCIQIYMAMA